MSSRYAVLLRGVTVGGNHQVPRESLKRILEEIGCFDITVYLNSGNAVFSHDKAISSNEVQRSLESFFNFPVPTLLIEAKRIREIASLIPTEWSNDTTGPDKSGQKSDVLYLLSSIDIPDIINKLGYQSNIETIIYTRGAVLINTSRKNQSKGSLRKLTGTDLYDRVAIRNINTAKKLAELL